MIGLHIIRLGDVHVIKASRRRVAVRLIAGRSAAIDALDVRLFGRTICLGFDVQAASALPDAGQAGERAQMRQCVVVDVGLLVKMSSDTRSWEDSNRNPEMLSAPLNAQRAGNGVRIADNTQTRLFRQIRVRHANTSTLSPKRALTQMAGSFAGWRGGALTTLAIKALCPPLRREYGRGGEPLTLRLTRPSTSSLPGRCKMAHVLSLRPIFFVRLTARSASSARLRATRSFRRKATATARRHWSVAMRRWRRAFRMAPSPRST